MALRKLYRPGGAEALDSALVLWMPGPETVTGEDLVELHVHGGRAVVAAVEAALADLPGLTPAGPGAFTRRAFENGRIDLTQVEGLADLLAAETERQRTAALAIAEGGLRHEVDGWQQRLLMLAARAEASIDFADEADVSSDGEALCRDIAELGIILGDALQRPPAERLRDGIRIGLAGPPNSGKSSLLNKLVGREAAITSPVPGTTRDLIEVPVAIGGLPIVFIDTAGLRGDADDPVERLGIARAEAALDRMDIVLWLGAASEAPRSDRVILVASKSDLDGSTNRSGFPTSTITGDGIDALLAAIVARAGELLPSCGSFGLTIDQRGALNLARDALIRASTVMEPVLQAEDLRAAMRALDRITGHADTEAMLDALFGRFCIGK